MAMWTFTNPTSRVAIEARIAERRRAESTMRANDAYDLPTAKEAREVALPLICRPNKSRAPNWRGFFFSCGGDRDSRDFPI